MTKKVLHILNELKPSGAEVMLKVAGSLWENHGIHAEILSTGEQLGSFAAQLESSGYQIKHLPFRKNSFPFCIALWRIVREYDLIHLHTENGNFTIGMITRLSGRPIVRTIHNAFDYDGLLRWVRIVQRKILTLSGVTHVSIGDTVSGVELNVLKNRTELVPNWYDAAQFRVPTQLERSQARTDLNISAKSTVLAMVGNCSTIKNHSALFDAIKQAGDENLMVLHVGSGDHEIHEKSQCARLGIGHNVRFMGRLDNPKTALRCADVYIMPSLKEGFSIAALEAIASGLPCLFSDVHGLRDLKRMFSLSCLWSKPDSESLAQTLAILTGQLEHYRIRAIENSERCRQEFGAESGVERYAKLYAAS